MHWLHGTKSVISNWELPPPPQEHMGGMPLHTAIFFTKSIEYASGAAGKNGRIYSATVDASAKVLNVNTASNEEMEMFRIEAMRKPILSRNLQARSFDTWKKGWITGAIMKFAPTSVEEAELEKKQYLAQFQRETPAGEKAWNELQILTRANIDDLAAAARDLGYDAVIGNEIDTLGPLGPVTYPIMFALNKEVLSDPAIFSTPEQLVSEMKRRQDDERRKAEKRKKKLVSRSRAKNRKR
jgi:hypothetical protein